MNLVKGINITYLRPIIVNLQRTFILTTEASRDFNNSDFKFLEALTEKVLDDITKRILNLLSLTDLLKELFILSDRLWIEYNEDNLIGKIRDNFRYLYYSIRSSIDFIKDGGMDEQNFNYKEIKQLGLLGKQIPQNEEDKLFDDLKEKLRQGYRFTSDEILDIYEKAKELKSNKLMNFVRSLKENKYHIINNKKKYLLEYLIRFCIRELLSNINDETGFKGASAPPGEGQGTGDQPAISDENGGKDLSPQPKTNDKLQNKLNGILFVNPIDKSKLRKINFTSTSDDILLQEVSRFAESMGGRGTKISSNILDMIKNSISNPDSPTYLYLGKYDQNSNQIFLMADKSLQIAKNSSISIKNSLTNQIQKYNIK